MLTNKKCIKQKIIQHDILAAQQSNLQKRSSTTIQALVIQHTPANYLKKTHSNTSVTHRLTSWLFINLPT